MKIFKTSLFLSLAVLVAVDAASTKCSGSYPPSTTSASGSSAASTGTTTTTVVPSTSSSGDVAADASSSVAGSASAVSSLAVVTPVIDCADLLTADLTDIGGSGSNITAAVQVVVSNITYCQVAGTLPPQIGFQVMLPVATWTQRYMQIGCGGLCGQISISIGASEGSEEVSNGNFALAATDMSGGSDGKFGLEEDRVVAFAYRAVHLTALVAKKLILQYYGQKEKYSYFNGCSDGGREAVMEALRYPDDFNGIIAGAPAMLFQIQNSLHHGWLAASNTDASGKSILISSRLSILHDAVVAACDALDGLEDGLLSEPRLCNFDPKTIECASDATDTSACLTTAEVETATKFYKGPTDATSGEQLTVGEQQYGSELAWSGVCVPTSVDSKGMSESIALAALQYLVFDDGPHENFTIADLAFEDATLEKLKTRHPLFDAVSPDLSPFKAAGGKLILWHGWADPHISPRTTIRLHEGLIDQMGASEVEDFERLYLLPGVYHCGDGEGMSAIDLVTPMLAWVESGTAPNAITTKDAQVAAGDFGQWTGSGSATGGSPPARALRSQASTSASGSVGSTSRSRPVYPYPALPKYTGVGDSSDATNYVVGEALYTNLTADWLGDDFFDPYTPIETA